MKYRHLHNADGREVSVGAIEPPFYAEMLRLIGAPSELSESQYDDRLWEQHSTQFTSVFASKTRDEWCAVFEGTDACVTPVLTLEESVNHPQMRAWYIRQGERSPSSSTGAARLAHRGNIGAGA